MSNPEYPLPFVLASTRHGTMILSHLDYTMVDERTRMRGVGLEILSKGGHAADDVDIGRHMLDWKRQAKGDGCVALDCGANIGALTIEWARHMRGWGSVLAIEAQERIFYALAGNIAIANLFNARAVFAAVGGTVGTIDVPVPDYTKPGSFGSLEIKPTGSKESLGQAMAERHRVPLLTVDSMGLERLDFLKVDVEGMELEVLAGAEQTIKRSRPYILVERLKAPGLEERLRAVGYRSMTAGLNILAMPADDPNWSRVTEKK